MKMLAPLLFLLAPLAATARGDVVAVTELRSRVPGDLQPDVAALTAQVRGIAQRTLPDASITETAKGADKVISGEVLRLDAGFLVTLAMHDSKDGKLIATASGTGSTFEELSEATAGAAVDLLRAAQPVAAGVAIGPAPDKPAVPGPLAEEGEVLAEVGVLVAYDKARTADGAGRDRPDVAAAAWREVAEAPGANPFREQAEARARQWETYAQTRHAYEAQLARDTSRLRKLLPLAALTDKAKLDLVVRFTRAYGPAEAAPMLALLAAPALRTRAELAVGCEAKDASKCVALAHSEGDPKAALDYLEQACDIGDGSACGEAGDKWLVPPGRDAARAIALLQRGCADTSASACARLARVYEEGDGVDVSLALAAETRQKACDAGDGRSCRKLACNVETSDSARALDLWQEGCRKGDSVSCALAELSAPKPVNAAVAVAVQADKPAAPAPAVPAVQAAPEKSHGRAAVGGVLVGLGIAAMGGAVVLANTDDGQGFRRGGRNFFVDRASPGP
ncbi:MAG TPA: hypothetical protein VLW85_07600, partial [Myxococcales bacterium]|nr:hypothetical protein [Myxococcales bacterium]